MALSLRAYTPRHSTQFQSTSYLDQMRDHLVPVINNYDVKSQLISRNELMKGSTFGESELFDIVSRLK